MARALSDWSRMPSVNQSKSCPRYFEKARANFPLAVRLGFGVMRLRALGNRERGRSFKKAECRACDWCFSAS